MLSSIIYSMARSSSCSWVNSESGSSFRGFLELESLYLLFTCWIQMMARFSSSDSISSSNLFKIPSKTEEGDSKATESIQKKLAPTLTVSPTAEKYSLMTPAAADAMSTDYPSYLILATISSSFTKSPGSKLSQNVLKQ
jgi:hypothetical protein